MKRTLCRVASFALFLSLILPADAQPTPSLVLSYEATRSNAGPGQCGCFFFQGGAAQLVIPLRRSVSVAAEVAGGVAPSAYEGYSLSLLTFTVGPQIALHLHRTKPFAEFLIGGAHGGGLPFGNTGTSRATGFAMVTGGGLDVGLGPRLSLRPAQIDYVYTELPNTTNGRQNNLRFSAGIRLSLSRSER